MYSSSAQFSELNYVGEEPKVEGREGAGKGTMTKLPALDCIASTSPSHRRRSLLRRQRHITPVCGRVSYHSLESYVSQAPPEEASPSTWLRYRQTSNRRLRVPQPRT